MSNDRILAVTPARGGSKGLPGKNIRPLRGIPLIGHTIMFAKMVPEITRAVVSTDSEEIAEVSRSLGGDVPFLRPAEMAQDSSGIWPVLQHALKEVEEQEGQQYDFLVLIDPTSPGRLPEDITNALQQLKDTPKAVGIVSVSMPHFNPLWVCVTETEDGLMEDISPDAAKYVRRQDVPAVYRINAVLYIWRTEFVRNTVHTWRGHPHAPYIMPEERAIHVDELSEFEEMERNLADGSLTFPWLEK